MTIRRPIRLYQLHSLTMPQTTHRMLRLFVAILAVGFCLGAAQADPFKLAIRAFQQGDHATALELWGKLAEGGDARSQYNVAQMYRQGIGVEQSYARAAHWYRKAAEQDHRDAQYILGLLFFNGDGVAQDEKQAAHWFRTAANAGHASAQTNLGSLYVQARGGLPKDYALARYWYTKAAEQGDTLALNNLKKLPLQSEKQELEALKLPEWIKNPKPPLDFLATYGPTAEDESLWSIADGIRPDKSTTLYQAMVALLAVNPEIKSVQNFNSGSWLRLPRMDAIRKIDPISARYAILHRLSRGPDKESVASDSEP